MISFKKLRNTNREIIISISPFNSEFDYFFELFKIEKFTLINVQYQSMIGIDYFMIRIKK